MKRYRAMKKKQSSKQTISKDITKEIVNIVEGPAKGQPPKFSQRDK